MAMREMQRIVARAMVMAIACIATGAYADVTISTKPTQNMTCSGGVCTPTAKKAVLNVSDLANMLATGDVTVTSGAQAQDIEIDAALSWTSTSRLTLDSFHSIAFNKPVTVAGTGALTITTNDGGSNGDFRFFGKGHVEFWDLTSALTINGKPYTLVRSIGQLAKAVRRSGIPIALAKNFNAQNKVFSHAPIAELQTSFEGLGNTISNLTISASSFPVGLFGRVDGTLNSVTTIRDLGLISVNISGTAASQTVGSLAGIADIAKIANSYVTGNVSGAMNQTVVGGLVGTASSFTSIEASFSAASVSGGSGVSASMVGGLVGTIDAECEGPCPQVVQKSFATGTVSGGDNSVVGGLVGYVFGAVISNSYSTGAVSGGNNAFVGGLVGNEDFAPGRATEISGSYSLGAVSGGTGATIGGFLGEDLNSPDMSDVYWDLDTSGINDPSKGAGNIANDPGITGLTDVQFKSGLPAGFDKKVWKEKANINNGYPYLIDLPPG